jgi:hypothetical protein
MNVVHRMLPKQTNKNVMKNLLLLFLFYIYSETCEIKAPLGLATLTSKRNANGLKIENKYKQA